MTRPNLDRLEPDERASLERFQVQDGASIGLRIVGLIVAAGLTIAEGWPGAAMGALAYFAIQGCRPRLPPDLVRRAEAERDR